MVSKIKTACFAAMAAVILVSGASFAPSEAIAKDVEVKKSQSAKKHGKRATSKRHVNRQHAVRSSARGKRHHYRKHVYWRSRPSNSGIFVLIGPSSAYGAYGTGWCRALHSGRHWAPRIGWHGGRHVGAVRCG